MWITARAALPQTESSFKAFIGEVSTCHIWQLTSLPFATSSVPRLQSATSCIALEVYFRYSMIIAPHILASFVSYSSLQTWLYNLHLMSSDGRQSPRAAIRDWLSHNVGNLSARPRPGTADDYKERTSRARHRSRHHAGADGLHLHSHMTRSRHRQDSQRGKLQECPGKLLCPFTENELFLG